MRKHRRGAILLIALFFAVVAGTAAMILLDLLPSEATSYRLNRRDVEGSQAVEAGVRDCMAWISYKLKNNIEPLSTANITRNGSLGKWNWSAVITADPSTPPNVAHGVRMYRIDCTALFDQVPKRQLLCWLQAGVNFSKYAIYTNTSPPSGWRSFFVRSGQLAVDGAFRTNGIIRMEIPNGYFNPGAPSTVPAFNAQISAAGKDNGSPAGDGISYIDDYPKSDADYSKLSPLGRSGFATGISPMAMPVDSAPYAEAAYGTPPPTSLPTGVAVNPQGGIYVKGDVDALVLSVDLMGNSVYTFTQGSITTTVTRASESGVGAAAVGNRLVQQGANQTVVPGLGSGVIFVTGEIAAINGTVRGANTIATDFTAGKDIRITGAITRQDTSVGDKPTSTRDNLGLMADNVKITGDVAVLPRTLANPLRLYASIFTQHRFRVEDYANTNKGVGGLEVFGSLVSGENWLTQFTGSSGAAISGYTHPSGTGTFRMVTDPNSAFYPPPLFPYSSNGQMEIRYWKETPL